MRYTAALCVLSLVPLTTATAQDTVDVKTGWNIIGSVIDGAAPDVLYTIPDNIITTTFFGYIPGVGYQSTDTLGKGQGYWIKVSADGLVVFNTSNSTSDLCGVKRVSYAGSIYHTVKIGAQCWLEENLDVGTMTDGNFDQANNATTEKYCYNNNPLNCAFYGGLYQWREAMQYSNTPGAQGICPAGWHIPTSSEFQTLGSAVGEDGNALKAIGQGDGSGVGTNTSGFSGLLGGFRYAAFFPGFDYQAVYGGFLSSSEFDVTDSYIMILIHDESAIVVNNNPKENGLSVRCIED